MYTKSNKICYGTFDFTELKEYFHEFTEEEINEITQKINDAVNTDIHKDFEKLYKRKHMCINNMGDNIKAGDILAYNKNDVTYIFKVTEITDGIIHYNKVYNANTMQMYGSEGEKLIVLSDEVPLLYYATTIQRELYNHPEINYIVNVLKEWEHQFPDMVVHYWFDNDTQWHIVVVEPSELQKNYDFICCENKLYNELYEKYGITDLLVSEPKRSLNQPINEILYKTYKP